MNSIFNNLKNFSQCLSFQLNKYTNFIQRKSIKSQSTRYSTKISQNSTNKRKQLPKTEFSNHETKNKDLSQLLFSCEPSKNFVHIAEMKCGNKVCISDLFLFSVFDSQT